MSKTRFSLLLLPFFLFSFFVSNAQTFEGQRITAWEHAGLSTALEAGANEISIINHGADNTGAASCNNAFQNAISEMSEGGTILFPEGIYLFTASISIPNNVFLKGEGAATVLRFNLSGASNAIQIAGSLLPAQYVLAQGAVKGSNELELDDASQLAAGDLIRIYMYDADLMFSSWAYGTLGQVVEVREVNGNTLLLADPLNHHYPMARNPYIRKLNARRNAGMECLKIERLDATVGQTSNIAISNAINCVVRHVESLNCNFAHLEVNSSSHIQVEGCYFHHAFAYGGGGQGYGIALQTASSFCLVQNSVFEHLRHSMLLQSGANGNVLGYNYSYDAYWTEGGFFPNNSAGDAVLHGNYAYLNLFEGNTVQNIVVDASHAKNGPYNTFFRNRAKLYGFFSDPNTPTDSMNVVGNEITNTGFPYGMFALNGNGHYSYGNNVYGTTNPANTSNVSLNSLYLNETEMPSFLEGETMPMVGYPLNMNAKLLQAQIRFENGMPLDCSGAIVSNVESVFMQTRPLLQIIGNHLEIDASLLPATVHVYAVDGRLLASSTSNMGLVSLDGNQNQVLLIQVIGVNGKLESLKGVSMWE